MVVFLQPHSSNIKLGDRRFKNGLSRDTDYERAPNRALTLASIWHLVFATMQDLVDAERELPSADSRPVR